MSLVEDAQNLDPERLALERQVARLKADLKSEKARSKMLLEAVEEEKLRADAYEEISATEINWRRHTTRESAPESGTSAILVQTDWHVEQRVRKASTNGRNEYTPKIAERRSRASFEKGLQLVQAQELFVGKVKHLVLALLGDFLSGYIHPELMESNYMSPIEATLFSRDLIASGLRFLVEEGDFGKIDVVCCQGNHGRTTDRRRVATYAENSFEWGLYQFLAREDWGETVKWHLSPAYHNYLKVQGHVVRFHHGDNVRYNGGVGGLGIPLRKKIAQWNKEIHASFDVLGHYHQFGHAWDYVTSGCLVGRDEFAISIGADPQPPSQTLILVSKKRGKVFAEPIFVE